MIDVLLINQKGGVGKSTIADELAFALERAGKSAGSLSMDPQGGGIREQMGSEVVDYRIIDTPGVLTESVGEWVKAADIVLIPAKPATRDLEPTLRTWELAKSADPNAKIAWLVNEFDQRLVLDRDFIAYLEDEKIPVWATIPPTVALKRAAALGISVAEYTPRTRAVVRAIESFDELANRIIKETSPQKRSK